jgi:hypothetical protein
MRQIAKIITIAFLIFCGSNQLKAQPNLIPNGGFEIKFDNTPISGFSFGDLADWGIAPAYIGGQAEVGVNGDVSLMEFDNNITLSCHCSLMYPTPDISSDMSNHYGLVRANVIRCHTDETGFPRVNHGAIGVSLLNGGTFSMEQLILSDIKYVQLLPKIIRTQFWAALNSALQSVISGSSFLNSDQLIGTMGITTQIAKSF